MARGRRAVDPSDEQMENPEVQDQDVPVAGNTPKGRPGPKRRENNTFAPARYPTVRGSIRRDC